MPATSHDADDAGTSDVPNADVIATIRNGGFWNDSAGRRIEAHGGGFLLSGDTWYWVGEDKSENSAGFHAVNCYASRDLQNWQFQRAIITPETAPELRASDRIIERPKLIYNASTHQFVMWLHWEGKDYATAQAGVFTSDTVCGDYTFRSAFRPFDNMSRDDTLFQDDDGQAYFVSAARENADLIIYQLTDDYLNVARQLATLWPGSYREAPAMFKAEGRYYLISSGATGWDSNQAKYATATTPAGPWSALQNLGNATTFDTQSTYVIPVRGTRQTTYLFAGDRWQDPDLASSKYIWLPLALNNQTLTLDYYDSFTVDLTTGEWAAHDDFISQRDWKLLGVSSEETQAENAAATRAFDDSASTFWHTRYSGTVAQYPHELRIDLGAEYDLTGLRYLPRQDGNENGTIAEYALYAGLDPMSWGDPVSQGSFAKGSSSKLVMFGVRRARYVRFVALREVSDRAYASVAELDFVGMRAP